MIPLFPLICAIVSPFLWGTMNILDKYVTSIKVKNPFSFAFLAGMVNLFTGLIIALFVSWKGYSFTDLMFPCIGGILIGSQFYLYYYLLQKEDVSSLVGLVYMYPIGVAVLSYFFLNEMLSPASYIGMALILIGVVLLSVRMNKLKLKVGAWMMVIMIMNTAFYEFFIKVATTNLPEFNGISLNNIFVGIALLPVLLHKKSREGIPRELKNVKWAVLNETFTFMGVFTLYFAMAGLPATIVSSLAATQPLTVLIIEKIVGKFGIKIARDTKLLPKLVAISLIVIGVIVLYLPELLKEI